MWNRVENIEYGEKIISSNIEHGKIYHYVSNVAFKSQKAGLSQLKISKEYVKITSYISSFKE